MIALADVDADEDFDGLDIHLSCRLSLKRVRANWWTTGPRSCAAKDLTRGGSFPLAAVTSARLLQVTFAPGKNTDRDKKLCPQRLAQPLAPTTREPLTR